jgi:hypothetical protein
MKEHAAAPWKVHDMKFPNVRCLQWHLTEVAYRVGSVWDGGNIQFADARV